MKTYLKIIDNMDFTKLDESDSSIEDVILNLKNGKFSNADKRKDFLKLLTQLALSNDQKARTLIKKMSKWLDDLGDEFITVGETEGVVIEECVKDGSNNLEILKEDSTKYKFESDCAHYGILEESEIERDVNYGIGV